MQGLRMSPEQMGARGVSLWRSDSIGVLGMWLEIWVVKSDRCAAGKLLWFGPEKKQWTLHSSCGSLGYKKLGCCEGLEGAQFL